METKAWFTILTPTSTSTIEMNPIPASTSASTSKDAADVEAISLKFDAQLTGVKGREPGLKGKSNKNELNLYE